MRKLIKKTISVGVGKEEYIIALFGKIGFEEIERKTTGGYMSEERIQITFEGFRDEYHENDYLKVQTETSGYFQFYSLRQLDGYFTNSVEIFKEAHDNASKTEFEICSFSSVL